MTEQGEGNGHPRTTFPSFSPPFGAPLGSLAVPACLALGNIGGARAWIKVLRVNSAERLEASPDESPAVPKS